MGTEVPMVNMDCTAILAIKKRPPLFGGGLFFIGVTGFEPATTCTPSRCPTRLGHTPKKDSKYIVSGQYAKHDLCSL